MLLGERTIESCLEYTIHQTYTIYSELIQNLENIEDCTIESNSLNNELSPALKTFSLLHNSRLNIFMGTGGVSEIVPYSSNNILGLTMKDNVLNKENYLYADTKNIKIYSNRCDFLKNLVF